MDPRLKSSTKAQLLHVISCLQSELSYYQDNSTELNKQLDDKIEALDFFRSKVVPSLSIYLSLKNKKDFVPRLLAATSCKTEYEFKEKYSHKNIYYQHQFLQDFINDIRHCEFHEHHERKRLSLEKENNQKESLLNDVNKKYSRLSTESQTTFKQYLILTYSFFDFSLLTYQDLLDVQLKMSSL
jgi:hypothetical protein